MPSGNQRISYKSPMTVACGATGIVALVSLSALLVGAGYASQTRTFETADVCGPPPAQVQAVTGAGHQVIAMACGDLRLTSSDAADSAETGSGDDDSSDATDIDLQIAATKSVDA